MVPSWNPTANATSTSSSSSGRDTPTMGSGLATVAVLAAGAGVAVGSPAPFVRCVRAHRYNDVAPVNKSAYAIVRFYPAGRT